MPGIINRLPRAVTVIWMRQFRIKSRRGALNGAHLVATQPPGYSLRKSNRRREKS